ncbi:MAG: carbamoyltransferase HypF [Myxococcota bacterium]
MSAPLASEQIRVRGTVQGVGFRPTVARLARAMALKGWVRNDAEGVLITLVGDAEQREQFVDALMGNLPPLARVDDLERRPIDVPDRFPGEDFRIIKSEGGRNQTPITPDAAACPDCVEEVRNPLDRRYRYPFTNCTHCGPRYTIITAMPYDRPQTSMAGFPMCATCAAEYEDEADRRYHAQPIACHVCGPKARLIRLDGRASSFATLSMMDDVDAGGSLLMNGEVLTAKGLGGYQLLTDATKDAGVARIREGKQRPDKPLALLARDLDIIRKYCHVSDDEAQALQSPANPIVLLDIKEDGAAVSALVAPGQKTLGFMLPSTPMHHLMLRRMKRPVVCTSGNASGAPQCIDDDRLVDELGKITDWALVHNRAITARVDDSVVRRIAGEIRILRRARGYAPTPMPLPAGFEEAPSVLAVGAQLKSTVCVLQDGVTVLSPYIGELDHPQTQQAWADTIQRLQDLTGHQPERVAADMHPGYFATENADGFGLPVEHVQHHHAHIAACLAENDHPLDAPPVLGIALDGLGFGDDGTLWGAELLRADYRQAVRLGGLQATPLLGGDRAAREPWRNLYAQLAALPELMEHFDDVDAIRDLKARPLRLLDAALAAKINCPPASSAGRLFDAVAAAIGLHRERISYEGQAAIALEGAVDPDALGLVGYPLDLSVVNDRIVISTAPLWAGLMTDLRAKRPTGVIAARFHRGLADAIVAAAGWARRDHTVAALSGGVWQNRILTELVATRLAETGWSVKLHRLLPPNDECIALGQAIVAAARAISRRT